MATPTGADRQADTDVDAGQECGDDPADDRGTHDQASRR
jgi:hypothetical protein